MVGFDADAVVDKTQLFQLLHIVDVTAVENSFLLHQTAHHFKVGGTEIGPFRDDEQGVGVNQGRKFVQKTLKLRLPAVSRY